MKLLQKKDEEIKSPLRKKKASSAASVPKSPVSNGIDKGLDKLFGIFNVGNQVLQKNINEKKIFNLSFSDSKGKKESKYPFYDV
jgi:hypothetical protein